MDREATGDNNIITQGSRKRDSCLSIGRRGTDIMTLCKRGGGSRRGYENQKSGIKKKGKKKSQGDEANSSFRGNVSVTVSDETGGGLKGAAYLVRTGKSRMRATGGN